MIYQAWVPDLPHLRKYSLAQENLLHGHYRICLLFNAPSRDFGGWGGAEREVVYQFFEPLVSSGLFNFQLPTWVVHSVFDMEIVFSKL